MSGKLYLAPIGQDLHHVLDIATGQGDLFQVPLVQSVLTFA
jgi:hypothetical protein